MPRYPLRIGTRITPSSDISRTVPDRGLRDAGRSQALVDVREHFTESVRRLDENLLKIIGRGIAYPFEFSHSFRGVSGLAESWGKLRIQDSIHLILATRPGERFFNPSFGSRLPLLVFEPYDDILYDDLVEETKVALDTWEPRIMVTKVDILDGEQWWENGQVGISIEYVVRNTNIKGNYVYPFQISGEPVP